MRISDWSSDVCSSDLVAATSAGRHDDLRALRHALARVATQHLAQERHRDPPLLGQRCAVELVEQLGQARQVAVDAAQQPRSEEHTSELQSLMRISYTVFCLKEKTQLATSTQPLTRTRQICRSAEEEKS